MRVTLASLLITITFVTGDLVEGTFFKKYKHEPEPIYASDVVTGSEIEIVSTDEPIILPDDEEEKRALMPEQECNCHCPKHKIIHVPVPKTQVHFYPVQEKKEATQPTEKVTIPPSYIPLSVLTGSRPSTGEEKKLFEPEMQSQLYREADEMKEKDKTSPPVHNYEATRENGSPASHASGTRVGADNSHHSSERGRKMMSDAGDLPDRSTRTPVYKSSQQMQYAPSHAASIKSNSKDSIKRDFERSIPEMNAHSQMGQQVAPVNYISSISTIAKDVKQENTYNQYDERFTNSHQQVHPQFDSISINSKPFERYHPPVEEAEDDEAPHPDDELNVVPSVPRIPVPSSRSRGGTMKQGTFLYDQMKAQHSNGHGSYKPSRGHSNKVVRGTVASDIKGDTIDLKDNGPFNSQLPTAAPFDLPVAIGSPYEAIDSPMHMQMPSYPNMLDLQVFIDSKANTTPPLAVPVTTTPATQLVDTSTTSTTAATSSPSSATTSTTTSSTTTSTTTTSTTTTTTTSTTPAPPKESDNNSYGDGKIFEVPESEDGGFELTFLPFVKQRGEKGIQHSMAGDEDVDGEEIIYTGSEETHSGGENKKLELDHHGYEETNVPKYKDEDGEKGKEKGEKIYKLDEHEIEVPDKQDDNDQYEGGKDDKVIPLLVPKHEHAEYEAISPEHQTDHDSYIPEDQSIFLSDLELKIHNEKDVGYHDVFHSPSERNYITAVSTKEQITPQSSGVSNINVSSLLLRREGMSKANLSKAFRL